MSQSPTENKTNNGTAEGSHPSQRRFARADVSIPLTFAAAHHADPVVAELINLGGGGGRFSSTEDLQRGELVTVHFSLPTVKHEIIVRAKVVLSFYEAARASFAHGFAFTQIAVDDQKSIVAFVESLQHVEADV